jgi:hypothetical protein
MGRSNSGYMSLLAVVVQGLLLVAVFSVTSNSPLDLYFISNVQMSGDIILRLNDLVNKTHDHSWLGETFPVPIQFSVLPMSMIISGLFAGGFFVQFMTYRISTNLKTAQELYITSTMTEYAQWDITFLVYVVLEHCVCITMLCSPISLTFLVLMTVLVTLVIVERCGTRADGPNNSLASCSMFVTVFVGLYILSSFKRHMHSASVFFILHVLIDMSLVFGHTADGDNHLFSTALNSRAFFVLASAVLLFTIMITHIADIAGKSTVPAFVSGIYGHTS